MLGARITGGDRRRPMLLALVFGVVLVLVGVTASALVAVASDHLANATLGGVVNRDATLVELFVNGELRADDLTSDGPGAARVDEVAGRLSALTERDGIVRIEIRDLDGTVLLSDERAIVGTDAGVTAGTRAAGAGEPMAALLESGAESGAAGALPNPSGMVQEFLPINDGDGDAIAVVALWRDAADLMARLDATRRDIMLVTLTAAVILAGILFLVFRAAQARLTRQTGSSSRRRAATRSPACSTTAPSSPSSPRRSSARGRRRGGSASRSSTSTTSGSSTTPTATPPATRSC